VKLFGTSRITVGRAVRDLQDQGLVERRAGSGTYVRGNARGGMTFALLIPALGQTEIFEPICQGMADSVEGGEHALLWCNVNPVDETRTRQEHALQLCEQYIKRKVSGVFFAPFESLGADDPTNSRIVEALDKARIPVVLLDRDFAPYPKRSAHDLVGIDNRRTGFLATEHLFQLGHRRVAFVSYPRTAATVQERIAGYREAHFVHDVAFDPALVHRLEADDAESVRRFVTDHRPDAFVCANDRTAGRLMQSLIAIGMRIPADVSIVGIDDIHYASLLPVPLTTIRQPCQEIGMAAMSTMLERVRRPSMPTRDILLECTLVERQSCARRES
jgi:GntR family transcriptional regulator of arabinose operon